MNRSCEFQRLTRQPCHGCNLSQQFHPTEVWRTSSMTFFTWWWAAFPKGMFLSERVTSNPTCAQDISIGHIRRKLGLWQYCENNDRLVSFSYPAAVPQYWHHWRHPYTTVFQGRRKGSSNRLRTDSIYSRDWRSCFVSAQAAKVLKRVEFLLKEIELGLSRRTFILEDSTTDPADPLWCRLQTAVWFNFYSHWSCFTGYHASPSDWKRKTGKL